MAEVFNYIELAVRDFFVANLRLWQPTGRHDSKTDRIGARVGLWDTALKCLSLGPRNDVTYHLVTIFIVGIRNFGIVYFKRYFFHIM